MAISYPIDLPLNDVAEINVRPRNSSTFQASPFTGRGQVQEYEGAWWEATLVYRSIDRTLAQPVIGALDSLKGPVGTFVIPFPGYASPLGTASTVPSSPTVNGSGQAGSDELIVTSAPVSETGWLLVGDIIQVGPSNRPHWHRVLADVDTDGSGNATIDVWPPIREGTISGDSVSFSAPLCLFRLTDTVDASLSSPVIHGFDVVCREAI